MWRRFFVMVLVLAMLLMVADVVLAQSGISKQSMMWVIAKKLTVESDAQIDDDLTVMDTVAIGGTLNVTGAATLDSTLSVAGATTFATMGTFSPSTSITVTNGSIITPTSSYQPITAAGAVGTSSIATGSAGQLLVLINTSNQTITITDTGTIMLGGNAALGQYDSLMLWSDGTNWVQVSKSDN